MTNCYNHSDALRKHWKSCTARQMLKEAIPAQQPPGRRRRACDNCATTKQGCDLNSPCGMCFSKSLPCSYGRLSDFNNSLNDNHTLSDVRPYNTQSVSPLAHAAFSLDFLGHDNGQFAFVGSSQQRDHTHMGISMSLTITTTFEFLDHLTRGSGLDDTFNCVTTKEFARNTWQDNSLDSLMPWEVPSSFDSSIAPVDGPMDPNMIEISQMMSWLSHPYMAHSKAIWDAIQQVERADADSSGTSAAKSTQGKGYIEFFNPFNLELFLYSYWNRWSFNCPIIHKSSFDLATAPSSLIFVLVLTGALMSTNPEHSSNAKLWLDAAEETVFRDPFLAGDSRGISEEDSEDSLQEKLRTLQGALLICVLQNWEGSNAARKRIRRQQYSAVVFVGFRKPCPVKFRALTISRLRGI